MALLLFGDFGPVKLPADDVLQEATVKQQFAALQTLLNDDRFETRRDAQMKLARLALERPLELARAAVDTDPETASRVVQALERVFQKHPNETGDNAERALEWLSRTDSHAALPAAQRLLGNARLRESRARLAIERLGGEVGYIHPNSDRMRRGHSLAPVTGVGFGEPAVVYGVWLHQDWKGTPDDLWHIERLAQWPDLVIYSIRGNGIPLEKLLRLTATIPGLHIQERGPCLGISSRMDLNQCIVGNVIKNSAAEKANLRINDEILQLNDQPVRNFDHLVNLLQSYRVGDEIVLHVKRDGDVKEFPVQLGSWRGVGGRDEYSVPPPPPFAGPFGPEPEPRPVPAEDEPLPTPAPVPSPLPAPELKAR